MKKITSLALLSAIILLFSGCVSSKTAVGLKSKVEKNNRQLLFLKLGMTKNDVYKVMGTPQSSEGYDWGTVWIFRTSSNHSVTFQGALDENHTPVVFDKDDKLIGWGRQVYLQKNPEAQP